MSRTDVMARAAAPTIEVVRGVTPDQLDLATPCTEFTVRGLMAHLLSWGPALEGAARKELAPPNGETSPADDDWPVALEAQITRTVEAWSTPVAWEGTTQLGGPTELPAALVGGMVVGEFVVHGWDLARGVGREPTWSADVLEYLYVETAKNADAGRELGVYGREVAVPENAPMLDRILGLTGRDPAWRQA